MRRAPENTSIVTLAILKTNKYYYLLKRIPTLRLRVFFFGSPTRNARPEIVTLEFPQRCDHSTLQLRAPPMRNARPEIVTLEFLQRCDHSTLQLRAPPMR